MKNITLVFFALLISSISLSQTQVTNYFNPNIDKDSNPRDFIEFDSKLFFVAKNDSYGSEIWYKDNPNGQATLLKDINLGPADSITNLMTYNTADGSFDKFFTILNGYLYFVANDGLSSGEIWRTDGTSVGTEKVTTFLDFKIDNLTTANNSIFFTINKTPQLLDLWKSDGTNSGTVLVKENFNTSGTRTLDTKEVNNLFIFSLASSGSSDFEIWSSDGTEEGTVMLIDELNGISGLANIQRGEFSHFIKHDNLLYFVVNYFNGFDNVNGTIKTDGTPQNTEVINELFEINTFGEFVNYGDVIQINDKIYFSFFRLNTNHLFIWEYDPLNDSEQIIYDEDVNFYFMCSNLVFDGIDSLVFTGPGTNDNTSLLKLNIVDYNVSQIKELLPDVISTNFNFSYYPNSIKKLNSNTFFLNQVIQANSGAGSKSSWITALTEPTTTNVNSLGDIIDQTIIYNNKIYFNKDTEETGKELWVSDGTNQNTNLSDNINPFRTGMEPYATSYPKTKNLETVSDYIISSGFDAVNGEEPRAYNFLTDSNTLLADINIGVYNSFPGNITGFYEFNQFVFFPAQSGTSEGYNLMKTNGLEMGTSNIPGFPSGYVSQIANFTSFNNNLFFSARSPNGIDLYTTDGDIITSVRNFGTLGNIFEITILNESLFLRVPLSTGVELWVSDGNTNGTNLIKTFSTCKFLTPVGDKLFFSANDGSSVSQDFNKGGELWKSDGTINGTEIVKDIGDGYLSYPQDLTQLGNNLIFSARTEALGREWYISDGTENGTVLLKDINLGSNSSSMLTQPFSISNTINLNNEVFFTASNGTEGKELWKTDGTENGTVLLKDINPGSFSSNPQNFVRIDNVVYFQASTANEGTELWKTDGTTEGTVLVTDNINIGALGSVPLDMIKLGDDLFFTATTPSDGRQLWRIENETLNVDDVEISNQSILFPNPTSSVLNIKSESSVSVLNVYDINGRLVKSYQTIINNQIDTSELNSGIYFVQYTVDGIISTEKVIKR
ncbi:MAG: ELWxxDGT repeat protein [Psychroserpens sp.]|uniref:ELWxxDGT repeat protein n=1 Tax=Psychroserpens sp. TaxID=2020870 RepID=UPI003001BCC1